MTKKSLPGHITHWIEESLGTHASVEAVHQLAGSTSSDLYKVSINEGTGSTDLVLRLFTNREWLRDEPDLAPHEAAALQQAKLTGLPVPEFVALDADGKTCGFPAVLMTFLPGRVNLTPLNLESWLMQQASALLPIHAVSAGSFAWKYFPYNNLNELQAPAWSKSPKNWQKAIEIVNQPSPPDTLECFIHRDYHPMNTLWQNENLSGIVDWVNACRGPASIDAAWNRLNLAHSHGVNVAEKFLTLYESLSGTAGTYHPYWDLMAIIEDLPGPPSVYEPWKIFGLFTLSDALIFERIEQYLEVVLRKF
jgi:aminoglycoside phosphotransferase (APT) family kinase protein